MLIRDLIETLKRTNVEDETCNYMTCCALRAAGKNTYGTFDPMNNLTPVFCCHLYNSVHE